MESFHRWWLPGLSFQSSYVQLRYSSILTCVRACAFLSCVGGGLNFCLLMTLRHLSYISQVQVSKHIYLLVSGAAEEANVIFGEATAIRLQQQHLHSDLSSQNLQTSIEDFTISSNRTLGSGAVSPRQLKHLHGNNHRDIPAHIHGVLAGAVIHQANCASNTSLYNTPSPMLVQVKFFDKLSRAALLFLLNSDKGSIASIGLLISY